MSDQVVLSNGEEADIVQAQSILLRALSSDANLDLKGGESPMMYLDKFSKIQPVYIIGALPGVISPSSSSNVVTRTFQSDTAKVCAVNSWTFGTFFKVPDGATKFSIMIKRTDVGAGTSNVFFGLDGSTDGITGFIASTSPGNSGFFQALRERTATPPTLNVCEWVASSNPGLGSANFTVPLFAANLALPPYIRVAAYNNDLIVPFTFDMFVVVQ